MDVLTTEHKNLGSNPTINGRAVTRPKKFSGDKIALAA